MPPDRPNGLSVRAHLKGHGPPRGYAPHAYGAAPPMKSAMPSRTSKLSWTITFFCGDRLHTTG